LRYEQELKSLPKFRSEAEERQFWETHDLSEYIEQGRVDALSKSKAMMTAISLRQLPLINAMCFINF